MFRKLWTVVHKGNWFSKCWKTSKMPFYAVAKGRTAGIYMTWADCEAQVKGFSGARYKKFDNVVGAQEFITVNGNGPSKAAPKRKSTNSYKNEYPGTSSNFYSNKKRSYSTASSNGNSSSYQSNKSIIPEPNTSQNDTYDSDDFPESDDLNAILTKQLDDVEKRLKGFEKNVDKIIANSLKSSSRKTLLIEPPQPKKRKSSGGMEFEQDHGGYVTVYTDGACSANGRNGAKAGLGVYWGDGHPLNISEPVSGRATNNCGEIQAATQAIKVALQNNVKKLAINTDSKFLINSVTKWIPGWKRKGWKLASGEPVKNEKDFKDLDSVINKLDVKWNYVEAHRGIHGNEMADQLAKAGAAMYNKKY